MAKLHLEGGITFEGTPEEIKAYTDLYAETPTQEEKAEPMQTPKLKAGDYVKFAKDSEDITAGKKYEIKDYGDNSLYFVDDEGDKRTIPLEHSSVYPYEIVAPPTAFERAGRKENEFKVGDVVRVLEDAHNVYAGEIKVVHHISGGPCGGGNVDFNAQESQTAVAKKIELIAPVESRLDTKEGA